MGRGGGFFLLLKAPCRLEGGNLTPTSLPLISVAGVRLSFHLCSCFPHKLDTRLGNNVASLII